MQGRTTQDRPRLVTLQRGSCLGSSCKTSCSLSGYDSCIRNKKCVDSYLYKMLLFYSLLLYKGNSVLSLLLSALQTWTGPKAMCSPWLSGATKTVCRTCFAATCCKGGLCHTLLTSAAWSQAPAA